MFKNLKNISKALLAAYGFSLFNPGVALGDSTRLKQDIKQNYFIDVERGDTVWYFMEYLGLRGKKIIGDAINDLVGIQKDFTDNQEYLRRIQRDTKAVMFTLDDHFPYTIDISDGIRFDEIRPGDKVFFSNPWLTAYNITVQSLKELGAKEIEGGYEVEVTEKMLPSVRGGLEKKVIEPSEAQGFGGVVEEKETKKRSLGQYLCYGGMIIVGGLIIHGIYDASKDHKAATGGRGGRDGGDQIR